MECVLLNDLLDTMKINRGRVCIPCSRTQSYACVKKMYGIT